jgi:tRNA(His) guanylyltransferase
MTEKDSLGDRMKGYERAFRSVLPGRMPTIIRVDGRAFHTYTRGLQPFSEELQDVMNVTALALCKELQTAQFAFVQSDEISILLHPYKKFSTQAWFDNQIQKMVSISAAVASTVFTDGSAKLFGETRIATFDSRVFVLPEAEVCNYFIWRQQDWTRNSVQMLARSLYSHKECHLKNNSQLQEMCFQKGRNWNDLPAHIKRGRCIVKETYEIDDMGSVAHSRSRWVVDNNPPIFTENREYVNRYLEVEEE